MTELEYCGPPSQDSPTLGPLEPGRRYQVDDDDLAAYLVSRHSDYWQRVMPTRATPPAAHADPVKE